MIETNETYCIQWTIPTGKIVLCQELPLGRVVYSGRAQYKTIAMKDSRSLWPHDVLMLKPSVPKPDKEEMDMIRRYIIFKGYNELYLKDQIRRLELVMKDIGLSSKRYQIMGRIKDVHRIHQKLKHKDSTINRLPYLTDVVGWRVVMEDEDDVYHFFERLTALTGYTSTSSTECFEKKKLFHIAAYSIKGSVLDKYFKVRGFRRFHRKHYQTISFFTKEDNKVLLPGELQIRSRAWHNEAENGKASHDKYLKKKYGIVSSATEWKVWLKKFSRFLE
jgi:ppGpp synthetase/RelA/SpoT-type nucleotidyltranferase